MMISLVVAMARNGVIGRDGKLPWHLPDDLKRFKATTVGRAVIMGRKTFESIGRPLPNRRNIVITHNVHWCRDGVETATSLADATNITGNAEVFIIGGAQIYAEALPQAHRLIVTEIGKQFACDTFFPAIDPQRWIAVAREEYHSTQNGFDYAFVTYDRQ